MEVEEQDSGPDYYPTRTPNPTPPDNDFFKYRITSEDLLEEVEHKLKGEVRTITKNGVEWIPKYTKWCNDKFISRVLGLIYVFGANKNTYLGNLSRDEINIRCNLLWKNISRELCYNYQEYGVPKEQRNNLVLSIVYTAHSALSRSEGGLEAKQISEHTQRVEHSVEQKERERSIIPNPFGMLRKRR